MSSVTDFEFEADRLLELTRGANNALDASLHVQFYKHAELNAFQSREQGRKIFDEKVYIRILAPANRLNEVLREATEEDRRRFAPQFAAFLKGAEQLVSGTPLSELPSITASQVAELGSLKVQTVEQLAGMADTVTQLIGTGGPELKRRAAVYLAARSGAEGLVDQMAQLKESNAAMKAQLEQLLAERKVVPAAPAAVSTTKVA